MIAQEGGSPRNRGNFNSTAGVPNSAQIKHSAKQTIARRKVYRTEFTDAQRSTSP